MIYTMNAHVASILEPLDKHLKTVFGELVAKSCRLSIVVAEVRRGMVFSLTAPVSGQAKIVELVRDTRTAGPFDAHASGVVDRH